MRLLLPILLIPIVLASQSLCTVHMHIGTHSTELGNHAGTPHFHAEAGHGHSHRHGGLHSNGHETSEVPQPGIEESPDHHAEIFYASDSVSRDPNRFAQDSLAELRLASFVGHELSALSLGSCLIQSAYGKRYCRQSVIARVPLHLRDASIRC